jgi:hypothetical protein
VIVIGRLTVVGGLIVVVVDGGTVVLVVVAPRVVVVVLFVVAVVVGGLVVVNTTAAGGTVGVVVTVVPFATALRNSVMRSEPGTAVVVVDLGEVAEDAPGDAARGAAAATDVGVGTSGTRVAPSARTGAIVGVCE